MDYQLFRSEGSGILTFIMGDFIFILLILAGLVLGLPVTALVVARKACRRVEGTEQELRLLREHCGRLQTQLDRLAAPAVVPPAAVASMADIPLPSVMAGQEENMEITDDEMLVSQEFPVSDSSGMDHPVAPPPIPVLGSSFSEPELPALDAVSAPASSPASDPAFRPVLAPGFNWEQFMGAKIFAWVGGFALFLGVIFFVKLSIERGWISPELRTALGFVTGAGLVVGGVVMHRRPRYTTLAQTLCATGSVMLYGVTFAAHSIWRIPPFDQPGASFAMMSLITGVAFLLAVRLPAQVVAVLGLLGGFLTPVLCSTGSDDPLGLFIYIALLDLGVLAVAHKKRWLHLAALAAAGTMVTQLGWMMTFFTASGYAIGAATWVPITVFFGFAVMFSLAAWKSKARESGDDWMVGAALGLCASALGAAFVFLGFETIADRPLLLYAFVLGINAVVLGLVWFHPRVQHAQSLVGTLTFLHLTIWTMSSLRIELLPQALGVYCVTGLLHTGFAVLIERREPTRPPVAGWVPVTGLVLLMMSVLCLDVVPVFIWPVILFLDLVIIGLAVVSGLLLPVMGALVLTLITAGVWLAGGAGEAVFSLTSFLWVVGGSAVVFGVAGVLISRRWPKAPLSVSSLLPVSSAVLPFFLLMLATQQLEISNPSSVFGLALLLVLFLLGLVRLSGITVLAPVALGCVLALAWTWHERHFEADYPMIPLCWYVGFYALFTGFPFVFRGQFAARTRPWIAAAVAGPGAFSLVYRLVGQSWPNELMGLLPAGFAIAPLCGLAFIVKRHGVENPARLKQLAWFGGVTLLFITLIFPIQFEKQWLTIGWALEGAALCWLFRRVPHPGLRGVGAVLLVAAFTRLALNPAVLEYQVRGDIPILNWQLYAYSLSALAMFLAAAWMVPPAHLWDKLNLRGLFASLGVILLFLLLNIEIADAFTLPGQASTLFDGGGDLARDMTLTISWGLFALALLVVGIWKHQPPARYAGIGLLVVTLLKLFLHDLSNIDSVYRIGALIGVALIALVVSFLYQRFLGEKKS